MIRKLIICLIACCALFTLTRCDDDEAVPPPATTFDVNPKVGEVDVTEFTFTIQQVDADAITLYPYGTANASLGTVPVTNFVGGTATVKFTYAEVGEFDAVVVTNNHNSDGTDVKNTASSSVRIVITSDESTLSSISLAYTTEIGDDEVTTEEDSVVWSGNDITVYMPWGVAGNTMTRIDESKLVATFETSRFATVAIGGAAQTSGETVVDFTSPKTYTVTSEDGSTSTDYTVTVVVQAAETDTDISSFTGKVELEVDEEDVERSLPGYVDNTGKFIVLYDTMVRTGDADDRLEGIRVQYELSGDFSELRYGTAVLEQDSLLNLSAAKTVSVKPQAPAVTAVDYTVQAVFSPVALTLQSDDLTPVVEGVTTDFEIELKVLSQTADSLELTGTLLALDGTVINSIKAIEADEEDIVIPAPLTDDTSTIDTYTLDATGIDFEEGDVKLEIEVTDPRIGKTYVVTYTVKLTQL